MKWRERLVPAARDRYDAITKAVGPQTIEVTSSGDSTVSEVVAASLQGDLARARTDFYAHKYEQALPQYLAVHATALRLGSVHKGAEEVTSAAALGAGACLLNLQRTSESREMLLKVRPDLLNDRQRCVLVTALAQVGEEQQARSISLPAELPDAPEQLSDARGLLDLIEGRDVSGVAPSPMLLLWMATYENSRGHVRKSAEHAAAVVERHDSPPLVQATAIELLVAAIMQTVFEDRVVDEGVPVGERDRLIQSIRDRYQRVLSLELPDGFRPRFEKNVRSFLALVGEIDTESFENALRTDLSGDVSPLHNAIALAKHGQVTAAIELLPEDDHPWRRHLTVADLLVLSGRVSDATQAILALAEAWPNRPLIDWSAAKLFFMTGDMTRARPFAVRAAEQLPSRGTRTLLAEILVTLNEGSAAVDTLSPYADADDPTVVSILAQAHAQIQSPREVEYWSRLARLRPGSPSIAVRLALALARHGDEEAAGRRALELLAISSGELSLDELYGCGQAVLLSRLPESRDAIIQIAEMIATKFGDRTEAEAYRLHLQAAVGFPQKLPPIDYERLASAGLITPVPLDQLSELLRSARDTSALAFRAYHEGSITIEALCDLAGIRVAEILVGIADDPLNPTFRLRTPVDVAPGRPVPPLAGRTLLLSALEVFLLEVAGALTVLVSQIEGGQLVLFEDVWTRLTNDRLYLEMAAQHSELERIDRLLVLLSRHPKVTSAFDAGPTAVVGIGRDLEPGSLLQWLHSQGRLPSNVLAAALRSLGQDPGAAAPQNLPMSIALDAGLLQVLERADALGAVLDAVPRYAVVDDAAMATLRRHRDDVHRRVRAANLAAAAQRKLGRARQSGHVSLIARPIVHLPAVKDDAPEHATVLRESTAAALAYKECLSLHPDWLRITAEFLGSDGLGHYGTIVQLQWKSESELRSFRSRYRSVSEREHTISEVITQVLPSDQEYVAAIALADLGVQDALSGTHLLQLANEYSNLLSGRVDGVLNKIEAAATSATDVWAHLARLALARQYAECIWLAYFGSSEALTKPAIALQLLERAWNLDQKHHLRVTDEVLDYLILRALDRPALSVVEREPDIMVPSPDAPISKLWIDVRDWALDNPQRSASIRRAVASGWLALDHLRPQGPSPANWVPIDIATRVLLGEEPDIRAIPHPDAVLSVLSALWDTRPLEHRHYSIAIKNSSDTAILTGEESLRYGATLLDDGKLDRWGTEQAEYAVPVLDGRAHLPMAVPPEAILLRTGGTSASQFAAALATRLGPWDGRAYASLQQMVDSPDDPRARRKVARSAVTSPSRLVSDDPTYIRGWGVYALGEDRSYPASIEHLRELLSEPPQGLGARRVTVAIVARLEDGGFWSNRTDAESLLIFSLRTPGPVALIASQQLVASVSPKEILNCIALPHDVTIGRLSQGFAWAATLLLSDSLDESDRPTLSAGLRDAIAALSSRSVPDGCLASVERYILLALGQVVHRIASPRLISHDEGNWLTYRLYEWWGSIVSPEQWGPSEREPSTWSEVTSSVQSWPRARLSAALGSLLYVVESHVISGMPVNALNGLVSLLLPIANQTEADEHDVPSEWTSFGWDKPRRCWELATTCALWIDPSALFSLRPDNRLRVLERLPKDAPSIEGEPGLEVAALVRAVTVNMASLSREELLELKKWLGVLSDSPKSLTWKVFCFAEIVASGDDSVEPLLSAAVIRSADLPSRDSHYSAFVGALAARSGDDAWVRDSLSRVVEAIEEPAAFVDAALALADRSKGEQKAKINGVLRWLADLPAITSTPELLAKLRVIEIPSDPI